MDKPSVIVLLSSYNGEKYIKEQLLSVLNQQGVDVNIIVRDDGSKDATISIVSDLINNNSNITLIKGTNTGSRDSFFTLLEYATQLSGKYIAFCDQDDVWDNNKLSEGIKMLESMNTGDVPALYCSNLKVVDSELNFIRLMNSGILSPDKNTSLLVNIATGCTCILNRALLDFFISLPRPENVVMHDWWLYALASFSGEVIYDRRSFINYRQHEQNVYGARTKNYYRRFINLIKSFTDLDSQHYRQLQAVDFYNISSHYLKPSDLKIVKTIAFYRNSFWTRLKVAFNISKFRKLDFRTRIRVILGMI